MRESVLFEFMRDAGETFTVKDQAVLAQVNQPLFAVGKLWKRGWCQINLEDGASYLEKDGVRIPTWYQQNSSMTSMRVSRAEAIVIQEPVVCQEPKEIRALIKLPEDCQQELGAFAEDDGWQVMKDVTPIEFKWATNVTEDPSDFLGDNFPHRTTLFGKNSADGWTPDFKSFDLFECAEEWKGKGNMEIGFSADVIVTLMDVEPRSPECYGTLVAERTSEGVPMRQSEVGEIEKIFYRKIYLKKARLPRMSRP